MTETVVTHRVPVLYLVLVGALAVLTLLAIRTKLELDTATLFLHRPPRYQLIGCNPERGFCRVFDEATGAMLLSPLNPEKESE